MSWCETKTGQINRELFELAHRAQQKPNLAILLKEVPSREIIEDHLLEPFEEFNAQFERFIENHGHREIDFDAYQPLGVRHRGWCWTTSRSSSLRPCMRPR